MRRYRKATLVLSIVVVLLLVICSLFGYMLYGYKMKSMSENDNVPIELENDSVEVKYLYDMAHVDDSCVLLHREVFNNKKLLANDMLSEYKSQLASRYFGTYVLEGAHDANGYSLIYVGEDRVRDAYDLIFGNGSGDAVTSVKYGIYDLKYNPTMKRFDAYVTGGGGWTCDVYQEEVIKAVKYNDRVELTTVVWFMFNDKEGIYRDVYGEEIIVDDFDWGTDGDDSVNVFLNTYQQQLQTYRYTFKLNDNGFYNYYSVERIKN